MLIARRFASLAATVALVAVTLVAAQADAAQLLVPSAYPTIQAAIDASVNGDEVVLADGVYSGPGNVEIDFGGRAITLRSANGATGCTIDRSESTAFRFDDGETASARIVDLTLTGFAGSVDAVQCVNASPRFEDCVFLNVDSIFAAVIVSEAGSSPTFTRCRFQSCSSDLDGGAIRHLGTGTLTVTACEFTSNRSSFVKGSSGGAIVASNLAVTDTTFTGNNATFSGGAIYCTGSLTIADCTFENNRAQFNGGAIRTAGSDQVSIEQSDFLSNRVMNVGKNPADVAGGAISATSPLTVRDCTFANNQAQDTSGLGPDARGGAISAGGPTTLIERCTLTGNRATTGGKPGAGQRGDGGAVSTGSGTTTFVACVFTGNLARGGDSGVYGGGAVRGVGPIELVSCRLVANQVEGDGGAPGTGAAVLGGEVTMTNCLTAQNLASACDGAGAAAICGDNVTVQSCTIVEPYTCYAMRSTGTASIVNSIVRSAGTPALDALGTTDVSFSSVTGVASGAGNIDAYPAFVNPGSVDYRLLALSVGVDVGDGTLLPADAFDLDGDRDTLEPLPVDLDGAPRIAGDDCVTDGPGGPLDMGAYEQPDFLGPCDCNGNTIDDATDISGGASLDCNGNGVPDECEPLDCDGDGVPDECDIAADPSQDLDGNGIPDACEPPLPDCNNNGTLDVLDVIDGTSNDCNANGQPDECDVTNGTSEDCNNNGVPDECGGSSDCNENGIPDTCDIANNTSDDCDNDLVPDECGLAPDCNGNGIPDACDIADETSSDCDGNGVPNECEDDCNGNGVADVCESAIQEISGVLGPVNGLFPLQFEFDAPPAASDVVFDFMGSADFGLPTERIDVFLNGTSIGVAYDEVSADCFVTADDLTIPAATFNALTASGMATLQMIPSSDVSSGKCVSTWVQVDVSYEAGGGCFGDFDGSGGIGFADLTTLLNAWGPCGACCPADLDTGGSVGFGDLTQLLNRWGPC